MFPADAQRIWWPQIVWRPITDQGMSLSPSSSCAACPAGRKVAPPSVERTTMIWESKSNSASHAASFWKFWKWTYRSPFAAVSGIENWFSSHAVDPSGPVVWNVQLGCVTAIDRGSVHVRPPSSDQLMKMSDETYEPCSPFWNSVVVT